MDYPKIGFSALAVNIETYTRYNCSLLIGSGRANFRNWWSFSSRIYMYLILIRHWNINARECVRRINARGCILYMRFSRVCVHVCVCECARRRLKEHRGLRAADGLIKGDAGFCCDLLPCDATFRWVFSSSLCVLAISAFQFYETVQSGKSSYLWNCGEEINDLDATGKFLERIYISVGNI